MLSEQLFRAARVIVDLGMHLELEIPAGTGFHEGERWTPELGLEFMLTRTITDPAHVRDEIDRYLGWPGQAPAYKIGERLWLAARTTPSPGRERPSTSSDSTRRRCGWAAWAWTRCGSSWPSWTEVCRGPGLPRPGPHPPGGRPTSSLSAPPGKPRQESPSAPSCPQAATLWKTLAHPIPHR